MKKNVRFKSLETVSAIFQDEETFIQGIPEDMQSDNMVYFKFTPMVSADVERRFCVYIKTFYRIAGNAFL